ncbi:Ribokinase-like protein [Acephala macrosclerotiorum]|nr:Ribokinase-like protein [Acephala macrosclerotiorum]
MNLAPCTLVSVSAFTVIQASARICFRNSDLFNIEAKVGAIFTTLSNLVIDELQFPSKPTLKDVAGGPGVYTILGARLMLPSPESRSIGWLIYACNDFPPSFKEEFESWDVTLSFLLDEKAKTARGLLRYEDEAMSVAHFTEISPALRIQPAYFINTPFLAPNSYHFPATPTMVTITIPVLLSLRHEAGIHRHPTIIWEPETRICNEQNLNSIYDALRFVDVVSPNHAELGKLFGYAFDNALSRLDKQKLEGFAHKLVQDGTFAVGKGQGLVVVRAAEYGCFAISKEENPIWVPAFYGEGGAGAGEREKVKDTTGARNSFLGAFAVGLERTGNVNEALKWGLRLRVLLSNKLVLRDSRERISTKGSSGMIVIRDRVVLVHAMGEGYDLIPMKYQIKGKASQSRDSN